MGFGRIIGGALAGAGTGMAQMAESRELERRATALENLRSQNTRVEQTERAQLTDLNDSRSLTRRTNAELVIGQQAGQQAAAKAEADRQAKAREAQAERDHDVRMTRLKGQEERMTASAKAAIEGGQVQTTFVADSGETMILTKSGKTIATGITATEKDRIYNPNSGGLGDGGVLGEVRGAAAAGTPKPAATPTPKPTTAPKPAAAQPAKAAAKPQGGTMTRADIKATAEAYGYTEAMAQRLLEQRGFKLKE
jgi:hypothetical protein